MPSGFHTFREHFLHLKGFDQIQHDRAPFSASYTKPLWELLTGNCRAVFPCRACAGKVDDVIVHISVKFKIHAMVKNHDIHVTFTSLDLSQRFSGLTPFSMSSFTLTFV